MRFGFVIPRCACLTVLPLLVGARVPIALGQSPPTVGPPSAAKDDTETAAPDSAKSTHDPASLEKEFEQAMTGARLDGFWQMTGEGGLRGDGALSPPQTESYVISRVSKIGGDRWIVFARITFADQDVNVPVPVRVVWAGDTAVITLDDIGVPLMGTYSARVMVHNGFYSGIWYSNVKNYGGVMAGRIVRDDDTKTSSPSHEKKGQ